MMRIKIFYDMKTAFIDIKMDIPFFKTRGIEFPNFCLRESTFDGFPCAVSDPLAETVAEEEKKVKGCAAGSFIEKHDCAARFFFVAENAERMRIFIAKRTIDIRIGRDRPVFGGRRKLRLRLRKKIPASFF